MNLIIIGPPGSGKGTQGKLIAERYRIPQISTGDILREAVRNGSALGVKAKASMIKGELVPDEVVVGIIEDRLTQRDCGKGFLLECVGSLYQRDDDKEETIRSRLRVYARQTGPVIQYYASEGLVRSINGFGRIDDIFHRIVEVIENGEAYAKRGSH
jgi:adenylate kinase